MTSVCCISGYWTVKNKYQSENYLTNFNLTLPLKCDFVFFSSDENINKKIRNVRKNLKTYFINLNINEFLTYKYYDSLKGSLFINPKHCPSKELWLIWMEKINLIKLASQKHDYEWYCWYDAGLAKYRKKRDILPKKEWPNVEKMYLLDKDKLNVTYKKERKICGTSYIIHKNFIDTFHNLFYNTLSTILSKPSISKKLKKNKKLLKSCLCKSLTDQLILTYMYNQDKNKFNLLCGGYGANVDYLE